MTVPYCNYLPTTLTSWSSIVIGGTVLTPGRFIINLRTDNKDIAFHMSTRFDQNEVVRNTLQNDKWGSEERHGGFPFKVGQAFEVAIIVTPQDYKVSVNGKQFIEYRHRIDKESVVQMEINGGVQLHQIQYNQDRYDPIRTPSIPYLDYLPMKVADGTSISICGKIPFDSKVFLVNLLSQADDIAFHFSVRFHENVVVRNSMRSGRWEQEERQGSFPFRAGQNFRMVILVTTDDFRVTVDGQHFINFRHRMAQEVVQKLGIKGDVQVAEICYENVNKRQNMLGQSYARPEKGLGNRQQRRSAGPRKQGGFVECPPPNPFAVTDLTNRFQAIPAAGDSLLQNVSVPLLTRIPQGMSPSKLIKITGVPSIQSTRFHIDIMQGAGYFKNADVALRCDVRFRYGDSTNVVARTWRQSGAWGHEDRSGVYFPFVPGQIFEMIIKCDPGRYMIAVNNQHMYQFEHRLLPVNKSDHLVVCGDVDIRQIHFQ